MDSPIAERIVLLLIYANAFLVGGVLTCFEMLVSRYLFPYFVVVMCTCAVLISTLLFSLTIFYLVFFAIVDLYPSPCVKIRPSAAKAACVAGFGGMAEAMPFQLSVD